MTLEKIANDAPMNRRGFIQYGLALGAALTGIKCGGGGAGGDDGSGSAGTSCRSYELNSCPTAREDFGNLPEWDVYEPGTTPADSNAFPTFYDDFKSAYQSNMNGIRDIFNSDEQAIFEKLMDGSASNDELYAISVTGSNRAHVGLNFGNKDKYFAQKQLSTGDAEILKSISPEY